MAEVQVSIPESNIRVDAAIESINVGVSMPSGVPGPQGLRGERGDRGPQGIPGPTGRDGAPGVQGPQGSQGPPGADGQDGKSLDIRDGEYRQPGSSKPLPDLPPFSSTEEGWAYVVDDDDIDGQYDLYFHASGGTTWAIIDNWAGVPGPPGPQGANGAQGQAGPPGQDGLPGEDGEPGYFPEVTTTGNSVAYLATIPGVPIAGSYASIIGKVITLRIHMSSTSTMPTLNINNMGSLRMVPYELGSQSNYSTPATNNWLSAGSTVNVLIKRFETANFVACVIGAMSLRPVYAGGTGSTSFQVNMPVIGGTTTTGAMQSVLPSPDPFPQYFGISSSGQKPSFSPVSSMITSGQPNRVIPNLQAVYNYSKPRAYRTAEQEVGTWIDGSVIYRRSFVGTTTGAANQYTSTVVLSNSGIDNIIGVSGMVDLGNTKLALPGMYSWDVEGNVQALCSVELGYDGTLSLVCRSEGVRSNSPYNIVVEYTRA